MIVLDDKDVFANTVTFARACDCIKELGEESVKAGCKAFIGYRNEFWVPRLHEMESRPLKDELAKPVIETSNIVAEELIKGKTVEEAVAKAHDNAAKLISQIIFSNDPYKSPILQALINNDYFLAYEGNPLATISPK